MLSEEMAVNCDLEELARELKKRKTISEGTVHISCTVSSDILVSAFYFDKQHIFIEKQ